jgi:hypothetical protein
MKQIGIWLDKQEALVVVLHEGKEKMERIPSELEFFNPKGGSRSKTRWGPQQVVHDSKYLEREKHQLKRYFDKLAEAVQDAEQLAIFGPAEAPEKFMAELEENYPDLAKKVISVEKADSQTDNQIKVLVKEAFGIDARYQ